MSLFQRMHHVPNYPGYIHGSAHTRNILVQPGPLTVAPSERTLDYPCFRIVDFGRTRTTDDKTGYRCYEEMRSLQSEIKSEQVRF